MAIHITKYVRYVPWDDSGVGASRRGSANSLNRTVDLSQYYTKIDLQTAGLAQVHFDNITDAYHNNLLGLQGGKIITDSSGTPSSEGDDEFYHLDEETYTRVVTWEFLDSLIEESDGTIHLINDEDNPGASKYYGTDLLGVKGWYILSEGGDSLWEDLSNGFIAPVDSSTVGLYIMGDIQTDDDDSNVKLGVGSLSSVTDGYSNIAIGKNALSANTSGPGNIAIGEEALYTNTEAQANIAIGYQTLYANTTGELNVAIGIYALIDNTEGYYNIAIGYNPMCNNTIGYSNVGIGVESLFTNTEGHTNTAIGFRSLTLNTEGYSNTSIGENALHNNTTGFYNVAIGSGALSNCATGSYNIGIGFAAYLNTNSDTNEIVIGNEATGQGSNTAILGGIDNVATYLTGEIYFVVYDSDNTLSGSLPLADSSITQVVMYDPITGKLYYGAGEGGTVMYTFSMSLNETTGTVTLDNDEASPGNYKFYGTDASGNKGWYDLQTVIELFA